MLRPPVDAEEIATTVRRLAEACEHLRAALLILDGTPVLTDGDALVDHALHAVTAAVDDVRHGKCVFYASPKASPGTGEGA